MIPDWLLPISIGLVSLTSIVLLLNLDWRWSITILGTQYIGVILLVSPAWEIEMAATILVAGWMAGAVLGVTMSSVSASQLQETNPGISERIFRLIAAGLIALVVISAVPKSEAWFVQINDASRWGGFILIGMGFLHLGLTNNPFRVTLGLLTILSGFEIIYAEIESSTLVAGLLAIINLGLALVCAYLLIAPTLEEAP